MGSARDEPGRAARDGRPRPEPGERAAGSDAYERLAEGESLETGPVRIPAGATVADTGKEPIPAEIWVLLVATFFIAVGFGLIVPVLPQYAESFEANAAMVAVVVSAFAAMRLVSAPVVGPLVDRLGERMLYVAGLLIVAASSFATAFAGDYTQLLVFRGLGGIGSVAFTIAASSMVVKFSPPSMRGRVSSLWGGMFLVGGIAGPAIGGVLAQFGMRVPFIVYAIALVIAAAIVALFLGRVGRRRSDAPPTEQLPPMTVAQAWALPAYRASLSFGVANGWVNFGMRSAVVPLFVGQVLSDEPWAAGAVVAVGAVGNVLTLQWAGRASDRLGRRPLIIAGLAVAALGTALFAVSGALWVALVVSFIAGLGSGLCAPAAQAAIADIIGRDRSGGRPLALVQMSMDVGAIVGPIVAGLLIDWSGYGWAFGLGAAILVLALLDWWRSPEPARSVA